MTLSKLFKIAGIVSFALIACIAYLGYRLYAAFEEHGEFEVGWAVSDPDP